MTSVQPSLFPDLEDSQIADNEINTGSDNSRTPQSDYISSIWSFPGSGGDQVYRWYGTLPRALLERLMGLYAKPNDRFLDPFLGTGTSLDVARELHLIAKGLDVNPLACLTTEVRLFGVSKAKAEEAAKQITMTLKRSSEDNISVWSSVLAEQQYDYMRKWFRPDTLHATLSLFFAITEVKDISVQRLMFVAAAQTVRDVASVDPRCT